MSQGYKMSIYFGETPVNFKNVMFNVTGDDLETSTSINDDGVTFNQGFSDTDADLRMINGEIDTIIKDTTITALIATLQPKTRYPALAWSAGYAFDHDPDNPDVEWYGVGLYIGDHNMNFNIPGEARVRMTFRSLQTGFSKPGDP